MHRIKLTRTTATRAAWSVCLSVCLLDTTTNCAKAAEPITMPFGMWTLGPQGTVYAMCGGGAGSLRGEGEFVLFEASPL